MNARHHGHALRPYPPGDLAIWVFIFAELAAFFALFVAYAFTRLKHLELFNAMQLTLDSDAGMLNTLLLITGSWCVARAVAAIKANHAAHSAHWLLAAIGTGIGFLIVKYFEYGAKFAAGIDLETNLFYTFYLLLTLFHAMHVVMGMAILFFVWNKTRRGGYSSHDHRGMETGASYWHMVDLVWIVLFPLVYVMR
jgi:nitric oxide reductase NorE protein